MNRHGNIHAGVQLWNEEAGIMTKIFFFGVLGLGDITGRLERGNLGEAL